MTTKNTKNTQRNGIVKDVSDISSLLRSKNGLTALREIQRISRPSGVKNRNAEWRFRSRMRGATTIGEDGVDHVNVSSGSNNAVGRILSMFDSLSYFDDALNIQVNSLASFRSFLSTGMKDRQVLVRPYHRRRDDGPRDTSPYLTFLMAYALACKVLTHEPLRAILTELQVPIDCYMFNGRINYRTEENAAYALALVEIQQALLKNREPRLWKFLSADQEYEMQQRCQTDAERYAYCDALISSLLGPTANAFQDARQEANERREKARAATKAPTDTAEAQAPAPVTDKASTDLDDMIRSGEAGVILEFGRRMPAREGISEARLALAVQETAAKQPAPQNEVIEPLDSDEEGTMDLLREVAEKAGQ